MLSENVTLGSFGIGLKAELELCTVRGGERGWFWFTGGSGDGILVSNDRVNVFTPPGCFLSISPWAGGLGKCCCWRGVGTGGLALRGALGERGGDVAMATMNCCPEFGEVLVRSCAGGLLGLLTTLTRPLTGLPSDMYAGAAGTGGLLTACRWRSCCRRISPCTLCCNSWFCRDCCWSCDCNCEVWASIWACCVSCKGRVDDFKNTKMYFPISWCYLVHIWAVQNTVNSVIFQESYIANICQNHSISSRGWYINSLKLKIQPDIGVHQQKL